MVSGIALAAALLPGPTLAEGSTGAIGGTVFEAAGLPVGNVLVFACAAICTNTTSGADGTYSIGGLAAGSYRVGVQDVSGKLPGGYASADGLTTSAASATVIPVTATAVPFDIHAVAGQHISGTITVSTGGPLQDVLVEACIVEPFVVDRGFMPCGFDVTAADGTYSLAVLPSTYRVSDLDLAHAHASVYYATSGPVFPEHLATTLAVGTSDIVGIDLALPPGASIAGSVTDSGGAPVVGMDAVACLTADLLGCASAATGTDGSYSVDGLPAGSYKVVFTDSYAAHPTGFYGAAGFSGDSSGANVVVVGASGARGIDVRLPAGHLVSGVVTNAAGRPAQVGIEDCTSSLCVSVASSGADGSYRVNVAPGKHTIHVSDSSGANLSGYYSAAGLANILHATSLTVGSTDLAGISVRLHGIGGGIHAGTAHTGSFVASTAVAKGTYATARFVVGKTFAGTRVTILRAVKSSTGTWSAYRAVATVVVGADGNAYYSAKVSGSIAFRAQESDSVTGAVKVLSPPVYVRSK